ncbi:SusC/RagA family TonB-linked outer membrane protein [Dyadobacter bucti]|uniref:SusC/RagA family TonB-linked outer membrane protein n=1 Tax=Dyadobacter bucti TaxID=2572203 RepID=UPI003F7254C8
MQKSISVKRFLIYAMQITVVQLMLSALFCGLSFARETHAQEILRKEISIQMQSVEVKNVLSRIEKQTGIKFIYSTNSIKARQKVSVHAVNSKLSKVLDELLNPLNIEYEVVDSHILLHKKPAGEPVVPDFKSAIKNITGFVSDEKGDALPGVSILVKGTQSGTTTNSEGKFSLDLPQDNAVLIFSFVGYIAQEIAAGSQTNISVKLLPEEKSLNEVVVTALGIAKDKKALTYAVTEVKGSEFTQAREANLGNALSGKIAGVNATSTANGTAGSSRVIIRGNGSLSGDNQPLYVVNGIPINNANQGSPGTWGGTDKGDGLMSINPDDIESISVLKGGTAAALYGSRAANGVIIITTKTGKGQKGLGVEFASTYTLERPLSFPDWQYQYGAGARGTAPTSQAEAISYGRTSWGAKLDGSMVMQPDSVERPYVAQKNNIKNFYDTGSTFSNTIAINGGNETTNFRFSASNMDNKGVVPNSSVNRKTFSLSASSVLAKKVVFEGTVQYNIEDVKNRTFVADFTKNPNASVQLAATNIDIRTLDPGYDDRGYENLWNDYVFVVNPYFAVNKVRNNDNKRRVIGSFSTRYNFTDYLYARGRLGIDQFSINGKDITPTGMAYNTQGEMSTRRITTYETNAEFIVGLNKEFGKISVNAIAGGNKMYNNSNGVTASSGRFNVPFNYFITNGSSQAYTETFREFGINSLFASADVGFNNLLYLTVTGRQDWFSTLSKDNNTLFYPSVGLSYVFSDAFKSRPSWLDYGKLRTSWAKVGGGAPDPYGLTLAYAAPSQSHLGQPLMNINGGTIPNSQLKPYTSTTTEFGLETKLFGNKLGADITFYDRSTTNDIVNATVPFSTSYTNVSLNVGKVQNRGVELLLTGTPVRSSKGFSWDVSFNMAYNKNTVVKIADGLTSLALPGAVARTQNGFVYHFEGMPFGMISGYRMRQDENGNTVYNRDSGLPIQSAFGALGRGVPPLTLGLTNSFRYKNLSLGFLLDGKFGSKMYVSSNAYATNYGLHKQTVENNVRETGVTVSGVDTQGDSFSKTLPAQNYYQGIAFSITDQFVSDAGFIKLRQLTLGYSLPQNIIAKTPFQSASLSFVARNLLLVYSQVKNVDPESNYSNSNAQGLENFGVPPTRSFGLNLLVRF